MTQDEAVSTAILGGTTIMMAAIDGAVLFLLGAAGLGYLSYKAYAELANRPADRTYDAALLYLKKRLLVITNSDLDSDKKKAAIKMIRDQMTSITKQQQQNSGKLKDNIAPLVGLGVFAYPVFAPYLLGTWMSEKLISPKKRRQMDIWIENKISGNTSKRALAVARHRKRRTPEDALAAAEARWKESIEKTPKLEYI